MQDTTTFKVDTSSRSGAHVNQRAALERNTTPNAIVNGEDDAIVNLDDVDSIRDTNLWRGICFRIPHATDSPYWEVPHIVNHLLSEFLRELTGRLSR